MKFLHWIDRTNEIAGKAVSFIMIPMLLVMVFEVVMRYGFDAPTIWGTEEETRMEVKEKIERVGKDDGYIMASANGLAAY